MIRYQVYEQSNEQHVVGRQSDTELEIIMRHFYLTYGKNQLRILQDKLLN